MKMLDNVFSNMDNSSQILLFLIVLVFLMLVSICIINAITKKRNQKYDARFNPINKYIDVMNKEETKKKKQVNIIEEVKEKPVKKQVKEEELEVMEDPEVVEVISESNSIDKIAMLLEDNVNNKKPIDLTKFEEEEERNAIISYDELVKKAGAKKIVYKTEKATINESKPEVKIEAKEDTQKGKFKASAVISPIYGVQKNVNKEEVEEFIELDNENVINENSIEDKEYENDVTFLTSLKAFRSNLD